MIIVSIISSVMISTIQNHVCKKSLCTNDLKHLFNVITYGVCIIIFGFFLFGEEISVYTIGLGAVFGIITALANFCKLNCLVEGPMHITLLIITSSMIIPAFSGVFFGERFSVYKLLIAIVLIMFIYLSLDKNSEMKISKKWLMCCGLAFLLTGSIGVLQKIHQTSIHKDETNMFLFVAFVFSCLFSRMQIRTKLKNINIKRKDILFGCACGVGTYLINYLNLKLSGILPSQLFFPLINGSCIILNSLVSVFVFKEHLNKKQTIGLVGGICSLILICIVP